MGGLVGGVSCRVVWCLVVCGVCLFVCVKYVSVPANHQPMQLASWVVVERWRVCVCVYVCMCDTRVSVCQCMCGLGWTPPPLTPPFKRWTMLLSKVTINVAQSPCPEMGIATPTVTDPDSFAPQSPASAPSAPSAPTPPRVRRSRLGCQVFVTPDLEGIEIQLPEATRNFYVDGHVPQPH